MPQAKGYGPKFCQLCGALTVQDSTRDLNLLHMSACGQVPLCKWPISVTCITYPTSTDKHSISYIYSTQKNLAPKQTANSIAAAPFYA